MKKRPLIIIGLIIVIGFGVFIFLKMMQKERPVLSFTNAYKVADGSMRTQVLLDTQGAKIHELDVVIKYPTNKMQVIDRDDLAKGVQIPLMSETGDIRNLSVDTNRGEIAFTYIAKGGVVGEMVKITALDLNIGRRGDIHFICNKSKAKLASNLSKKSSLKCVSNTLTPVL